MQSENAIKMIIEFLFFEGMGKRRAQVDTNSNTSSAVRPKIARKEDLAIDWTKCVLCQRVKPCPLVCPLDASLARDLTQ
jgi:ferredoxin